jgi:hypothetical protein
MCTVRTQDSSSGVTKVGVAHRMESGSFVRQLMTMKAEPRVVTPGGSTGAQLSPLCTVLSWHAGSAHNMTSVMGETTLSTREKGAWRSLRL